MRTEYLLAIFVLSSACCIVSKIEARTVFRRTDKISENFKQLDLPAEEIDPNVAPPKPQKVQTIDPVDVISEADAEPYVEAVTGSADDSGNAANELLDESANEIADSGAAASPASLTQAVALTTVAPAKPIKNEDDKNPISKYCKCTDTHCDCCRNFGLPLIPVRGPGCAKIAYLGNDEMSVSLKYGDITLATRRISSKKARPICVGLPGGYSKFCGRVYGLSRAKDNFKACLAFELRAEDEVEAALRVSCFRFGPDGLRVAEAEPLPTDVNKQEDDDDDDDIFGLGGGDDDDDEEDDYDDADDADTEADEDTDDYVEDDEADAAEAPEDADYGGFSLGGLLDELDDDDDEVAKPVAAAANDTTTPVATTAILDQTRGVETVAQSKNDAGLTAAPAPSVVEAVEAALTVTPAPVASDITTVKSKKSKKAKKNKKKKAAVSASETDFAYELINGILDFFN